MRTEDKDRVHFYAPPEEKARLEKFAKSTGRTKTDILRELIRGLPNVEEEQTQELQLPEGWRWNVGLTTMTSDYLDYAVELRLCDFGYEVWVNTKPRAFVFTNSPDKAIKRAREIVDQIQEQLEERYRSLQ